MALLDEAYFDYHPDMLLRLREWLPSHRNINLNDKTMCIFIRHEALGLTSKRNEQQDLSIGWYLQDAGGIERFLNTPPYKQSLPVACVIFTK